MRSPIYLCCLLLSLTALPILGQEVWPAGVGVEIGLMGEPSHLPPGFEPSGAVWHNGRQRLLVVSDDGYLAEMRTDGGDLVVWEIDEDLEAVAVADHNSDLVYLGVEHPDGVIEFDLATGAPTGETWDLRDWLDGPHNMGLEALTVLGTVFLAGLQDTGEIFSFRLSPGGEVIHLDTHAPPLPDIKISGLHYAPDIHTLFAIYDGDDLLLELAPDGSLLRSYELAGHDQEGIAMLPASADETVVFITQDTGEIWRYAGYPVTFNHTGAPAAMSPSAGILTCQPNPFNPVTTFHFTLVEPGYASLSIFDVEGRLVREHLKQHLPAGSHAITWWGGDNADRELPNGVYLARLQVAQKVSTARLVLLK
ncbi:MAG: T9SS type A sorting domain-containing protein [bacterium]|nr:T9SS type A sorting domain-containing protein [bacterium]